MIYKTLGNTGLKVSVMGYGASPLGNVFGMTDKEEGRRAVHQAIDQGVNYFDVSPFYGENLAETRLGEALAGQRDQVILATKCGHYGTNGKSTFDFSAERVASSLEESLERLQTDYIDVFQAHDINAGDQSQIINETVPAMLRLKESGKVRFVGITGMDDRFLREVAQAIEVDTVLSFWHYDLVDTSLAEDLGPFAQENHLGMINASPLHMRLLTRKGPPDWYRLPEPVVQKVQEADAYCAGLGFEISDLAMAFALQNPYAATTLVGMSKVRHLTRNLAALDAKISPEVLAAARKILEPATAALADWQQRRRRH